ncbi:MAG: hypothetical protein M1839_004887, partial [Geoglossum umbratile]
MQQQLSQHSVPVLEKLLKTFSRTVLADITFPKRKESILSHKLRMILESPKPKMTIVNIIMLLRDFNMMLKGICYWYFHQETGLRSDK